MLSSCFFVIGIGFICEKNFIKSFQRLFGRIPRRFWDRLKFSIIQVFTHFLEFLKICPKMFPFFRKNDRPMSADSERPNVIGGNWMKHCTVAKSVGQVGRFERPSSSARASLALCGRFDQFRSPYSWLHDAQSAAKTTSFWLRSELP